MIAGDINGDGQLKYSGPNNDRGLILQRMRQRQYFFVIGLLAEKATRLAAIPILLLYNLFFVLPLIIINLLFYFYGKKAIKKTDAWKERNLRNIHLVTGIIMIILGIIVIFELF